MSLASRLAVIIFLCACGPVRPRPANEAPQLSADAAASAAAHPAKHDAGRDAGTAALRQPWQVVEGTVWATLIADARGAAIVLAVGDRGINAYTPDQRIVRELVKGQVTRAEFNSRSGMLTFIRNERLEVLDLAETTWDPVVLVEGMPDLIYLFEGDPEWEKAYCSSPCVAIRMGQDPALAVRAMAEAIPSRTFQEQVERELKVAAKATPRLTEAGKRWLGESRTRTSTPLAPSMDLGEKPVATYAGRREAVRSRRMVWPRIRAGGTRMGARPRRPRVRLRR